MGCFLLLKLYYKETYNNGNSLISREFSWAYFCKNSSSIFILSLVARNMFSWLLFRGKSCKIAHWLLGLLLLLLEEIAPPLCHSPYQPPKYIHSSKKSINSKITFAIWSLPEC